MTKCHTVKVGRKFQTSGQLTQEKSATVHLIYRYQLKTIASLLRLYFEQTLDFTPSRCLSSVTLV